MKIPSWRHIYLGIGLTSLATLLLELSITRLFSVILYYHFAFMAVSIALFGLGVGGMLSYLELPWLGKSFSKLGILATLNSLVVVLVLLAVVSIEGRLTVTALAKIYFCSALPFLLAGTVLSMVISETIERVDRVYFFDLLGAGAGCLLLVPLLNWLGGPNTILVAGMLYALSGLVWFKAAGMRRALWGAAALCGGFVAFVALNHGHPVLDVRYAKGAFLRNERYVQWNSFSRIALMKRPEDYSIEIDADANTHIAPYDFNGLPSSTRHDLVYDISGIPYVLRPGARTLIIGPGGGLDVARALASGSSDITGVEINPIIATTIMRERFSSISNGLYFRPEVHIVVEDGRSYVRRSQERYQVLQATLVDTWASTAAGAFALSENNLYTKEAFLDYLNHLTDDGIISFTRWGFDPPRESLRLLALARVALLAMGEQDYTRHIIAVRKRSDGPWGHLDTVLISRKPFTGSDLARLRNALAEARLELLCAPAEQLPNSFSRFLRSPDVEGFERDYPYLISAVDDNRPFFFYTVQPRELTRFVKSYLNARARKAGEADYKINAAIPALFALFLVSITATVMILLLPPLIRGTQLPCERTPRRFLWYFLAIGMGYILIEIALIQKCVLFLGHPTYALTVIVFSMLVSSSVGSYYSGRVLGSNDGRLSAHLIVVAMLVGCLSILLAPVMSRAVGLPLSIKIPITICLIAPAGVAMGMPFPTGLRRLERLSSRSVRWAWSLNAAASVLGSVSAITLAIYFGLRVTLLAGGALYLFAAVVVRATRVVQTVRANQTSA